MSESIWKIFQRSPQEALDETFRREQGRLYSLGAGPRIFVWSSTLGVDGQRYGIFRYVTKEELDRRTFTLNCFDYKIGIDWTDCLFYPGRGMVSKHDKKSPYDVKTATPRADDPEAQGEARATEGSLPRSRPEEEAFDGVW